MPNFKYRAYSASGEETSGVISAESEKHAALRLRELGIFTRELSKENSGAPKPDLSQLPFITRELSLLIASGVTILDSLHSLQGELKGSWKRLIELIADDVSSGISFSRALEKYPVFPQFYTRMVASGEASGTLEMVLKSLADFLDEDARTKSRIKSAMVYPAFMAAVGAVVLSFIFGFVMPKILKLFKDSGRALPLSTRALIFISNIFIHYWWALFLLLILAVYALRRLYREKRPLVDSLFLRLAVFRSLFFSRFTRSFGFLLEGGLPVLKALELAGPSSGNAVIEEKITLARERISEGAELSTALEGFPPVLVQLVATGQKSGRLSEAVKKAASSYDEDFKRRLERGLSLIEPTMILAMGVIVGFIVMAVLLPIFELNQIIK
jgi:general secretion pathway protein F